MIEDVSPWSLEINVIFSDEFNSVDFSEFFIFYFVVLSLTGLASLFF